LTELVNDPLPKASKILDIDTICSRTDEEVRDFIKSNYPQCDTSNLVKLNRFQQNEIISMAIEFGAALRQIVRITGIPYGIVRKVK